MEFNATFLVSVISFVLFVIIMNLIFYKPLAKIVNERDRFIDENFDEAKKNNCNAQKITDEYSKKIDEINSKNKEFIAQKTQQAKEKRDELIFEAQKQAADEIQNNKEELNQAFAGSKESLKSDIVNLANQISKKLFGEKILLNNVDKETISQIMDKG